MAAERPGLIAAGGAAALTALVAAAALGVGAWRGWLAAAVLAISLPTGGLLLLAMLRLIPGAWREGLAAPLAAMRPSLAVGGLAMAPLLVAPGLVYPWAGHPGPGAFRMAWLSPLGFTLRGAAWIALLAVFALRLRPGRTSAATAAAGLVLLAPLGLPIAVDWLMSLDPDFVSSGFGLYVLAIQALLAASVAVALGVGRQTPQRTRDVLGGVLFTLIVLWAYAGFMQYFITWSNDLPAGAAWYLRRGGGWGWLAFAAIALKGAPGLALVAGPVRRHAGRLRLCAALAAAGAAPELAWLTLPAPGPRAGAAAIAVFLVAAAGLGTATLGVMRLAAPKDLPA